jgi:hypothetical protein
MRCELLSLHDLIIMPFIVVCYTLSILPLFVSPISIVYFFASFKALLMPNFLKVRLKAIFYSQPFGEL